MTWVEASQLYRNRDPCDLCGKKISSHSRYWKDYARNWPQIKWQTSNIVRICVACLAELKRRRKEKIRKNADIIRRTLKHPRNKRFQLRRYLAVYRLYRKFDLTPSEISSLSILTLDDGSVVHHGITETTVKKIIGETFTFLCKSDKSCDLRGFLLKTRR